jgi:hypothetical protein
LPTRCVRSSTSSGLRKAERRRWFRGWATPGWGSRDGIAASARPRRKRLGCRRSERGQGYAVEAWCWP